MRIIDLLHKSAASHPQTTAAKCAALQISYPKMLADVRKLAEKLRTLKCAEGIKVALVLKNSIEYLISFFAVSAARGIILPLAPRMTTYELTACIEKADVSILITDPAGAKELSEKLSPNKAPTILSVEYDRDASLHMRLITTGKCITDHRNRDVALMVPTSGTTGPSKIAMLTDNQLISNMLAYRSLMAFAAHNIVYCALSMHHIYPICAQILTHASTGDTFLISDKPFFVHDFLNAVHTHNVTITALVPYMAVLLAQYPQPHRFNLETLQYVTLSGAKTPPSTYRSITEKYPHTCFINTYGMTEAGSRIAIAAPSPERFPIDSVGRPMPRVEVKIIDQNGKPAVAGAAGEILLKSSGVMKGYYNKPDLTARTIADGWLRTGDLGKLDQNGNLYILGRKKDIIITGGENVYPAEIEQCLTDHPAIREAVVVPRPHELLQEVPFAFIVAKSGVERPTSDDIIRFCKARLSTHKIPCSVRFVQKLPRLGTSKADRKLLRKTAAGLPLI